MDQPRDVNPTHEPTHHRESNSCSGSAVMNHIHGPIDNHDSNFGSS